MQLALALLAWLVAAWRTWAAQPALALALLCHALAFQPLVMHRYTGTHHSEAALARSALVELLEPAWGRYRVYQDVNVQMPENFADAHRIQSRNGYGATMYRPYFDFISEDWSHGSLHNDLLNVRWVVAKESPGLRLVLDDPVLGVRVYERDTWYPRVFLREQLGMKGADIERELGLEIEAYADHYQRYRLRAARATTAIVSEIDYPGWCAQVNGRPVAIARARIEGTQTPLLREVPVEAGDNVIEMHYRPLRSRVFGCD